MTAAYKLERRRERAQRLQLLQARLDGAFAADGIEPAIVIVHAPAEAWAVRSLPMAEPGEVTP